MSSAANGVFFFFFLMGSTCISYWRTVLWKSIGPFLRSSIFVILSVSDLQTIRFVRLRLPGEIVPQSMKLCRYLKLIYLSICKDNFTQLVILKYEYNLNIFKWHFSCLPYPRMFVFVKLENFVRNILLTLSSVFRMLQERYFWNLTP